MAETCDAVAFLDANFEEALGLAIEARDYMAREQNGGPGEGEPLDRMALSYAAMRVTSRLTQVMAWLMVQKAVQAGELTRRQAASEPNRLSAHDVCLGEGPLPDRDLPPRFAQIDTRSRQLYERIARLDSLLDEARSLI